MNGTPAPSSRKPLLEWVRRAFGFLFDTSEARRNEDEVRLVLERCLLVSKTDEEFDKELKEVLGAMTGTDGFHRHAEFRRFMALHGRDEDRGAPLRTRAEHLLQDLSRR